MKNVATKYFLIGFALVCVLLNVIIFLTLPKFEQPLFTAFWLTWSFAFPFALILQIIVALSQKGKLGKNISGLPIIQYTAVFIFIAHLIIFVFFGYVPALSANFNVDSSLPLILDLTVIVVGILVILSALYAFHQDKTVSQKVTFISLLSKKLDSCALMVTDENVLNSIKHFAESVKFSDPMSHPSLTSIENQISQIVNDIVYAVSENKLDSVVELCKKGEFLLAQRNGDCIALK
jgi:hypothetical protein